MRSLAKRILLQCIGVANVVSQGVFGRKLIVTNQVSYWKKRGDAWRTEDAGVSGDPYYDGLDRRLVATLAGLKDAATVLEVGCFFGRRLALVRGALADRTVIGLDRLAPPLETAAVLSKGHLIRADATKIPLTSSSVDCAYTVVCLSHIPKSQVTVALGEMARVARRYVVLIEVFDKPMHWRKRLQAWSWGAGYCHDYRRLLGGHSFHGFREEPLLDSNGHPRYTMFVAEKNPQ